MFSLSFTSFGVIISALIGLYLYLSRNFNYWSSRGIKGPKPIILLGNVWELFFRTFQEVEDNRLEKYGKIYGAYMGSKPQLVVAEPELVKNIMIKDFHLFVNHNNLGSIDEIADHSLLSAEDEEWKRLRSIVSPTFSTGKIRKMHAMVEHCVKGVDKMLEKAANGEQEVDVRSLMGNYTMDGIASCAFATKTDTHNDPNNPFIINARKLFSQNMWRSFGYLTMKPVMKFFNISILEPTTTDFFKKAITEIVSQRKKDKSGGHHDFLQLMINAQKNVDNLDDIDDKLMAAEAHHGMDDNSKLLTNKSKLEVSDLDILANSLLFFLAGFETTGHLLSHMSYLLAINPECQKKLMEEVVANTDANGN
ncbi:unnamed protein product, partial [Medioppia subpectinata]